MSLTAAEATRAVQVAADTRLIEQRDTTVVLKDFKDAGGVPLLTMRIDVHDHQRAQAAAPWPTRRCSCWLRARQCCCC